MLLAVDALAERITAALLGAAAGEAAAGAPAGAGQVLELAESLAEHGELDDADLRARGLDQAPATGRAGLLLRAVPIALLTPLDRPRLRRTAHRAVLLGGGDEGTAVAGVATAALTADLCRFDLATALVRLRQTLLEEAPMALLDRLRPLGDADPTRATGDPVHSLQLAITALDRADDLPGVLAEASGYDGDAAAAVVLAAALAGVRSRLAGAGSDWVAAVPAQVRVHRAAAALAARAVASLPGG